MTGLPLFADKQPGGMLALINREFFPGDVFWVDSGHAAASDTAGFGRSPSTPVATLDYANDLCAASNGDVIFLMPGHAEAIASDSDLLLNLAGVKVIGLGWGNLIATFTLGTDAGATIGVTGASVWLENLKIISDLADVAAGITASAAADGLTVKRCWLSDGAAAKELVIGVSCAAACDNVHIENNRFQTVAAGGCASAIKFVGATANSRIINNYAHGDYSVACLDGVTATGTNILIDGNKMVNVDTGAGLAISLDASTTGQCINNRLAGNKAGTSPISADGLYFNENYCVDLVNESGIVKPDVTNFT